MSSRERAGGGGVNERERQKQLAREKREMVAASSGLSQQEREPQPVVFETVRRSPNLHVQDQGLGVKYVERILGKCLGNYDELFTK